MCQISHDLNRTGLVVCSIFSRKGARIARNFNVFFVFSPNAFAYFVPRRDFIYFSLAKAPRSPRTSMFLLCLPQTPLRTLRLGESIFFFSRRGAENNYRYKGRVTRDKKKQRRYQPLLLPGESWGDVRGGSTSPEWNETRTTHDMPRILRCCIRASNNNYFSAFSAPLRE